MIVVDAASVPPNRPGPPRTEYPVPQVPICTPPHASPGEENVLLYAVEVEVRHRGDVDGVGDVEMDMVREGLPVVEGEELQHKA